MIHHDLDDVTDAQLEAELKRRKALRDRGLCDYCKRLPTTPPCKHRERHHAPSKADEV